MPRLGGEADGRGSRDDGRPATRVIRERCGRRAGAMQGIGIGRLVHAIRARRQMEEQQDAQSKEQQQRQAQLQKYDRAFGACLTGRGYTVQ